MNLPYFIARHLSMKSGDSRRKSPGIAIAVTGVSIAIAVMIVTLAVVTGFKHSIRDRVIGFESELTVTAMGTDGEDGKFVLSDTLISVVKRGIDNAGELSESISTTALIKTDNDFIGLTLKANSPGSIPQRFIADNIVEGTMPDFECDTTRNDLVVSCSTATLLNLHVGEKVMVYFVDGEKIKTRRMKVAALYDTSFGERDMMLAICSLDFLRSVRDMSPDETDRIEINGLRFENLEQTASALQNEIANSLYAGELQRFYKVDNVLHTGAVYFSWLELLDTNVVVIILLMSVVAAFTLISCLFILILERVGMIGILKALGSPDMLIRKIFIYMALKIMVTGMFIGNLIGLLFVYVQGAFHLIPLDPAAYYLPYVPVEISPVHIILLNLSAIAVAWAVLVLPTMIITRISPSVTMRYE